MALTMPTLRHLPRRPYFNSANCHRVPSRLQDNTGDLPGQCETQDDTQEANLCFGKVFALHAPCALILL